MVIKTTERTSVRYACASTRIGTNRCLTNACRIVNPRNTETRSRLTLYRWPGMGVVGRHAHDANSKCRFSRYLEQPESGKLAFHVPTNNNDNNADRHDQSVYPCTCAWTINEPHLPYKTGPDIMQSHPLRRMQDGDCYIMHRMQSGGWPYSEVGRACTQSTNLPVHGHMECLRAD